MAQNTTEALILRPWGHHTVTPGVPPPAVARAGVPGKRFWFAGVGGHLSLAVQGSCQGAA